jgi:deoxyribodipyrimidine photo-lyase
MIRTQTLVLRDGSPMTAPLLVWFRDDLRVADHAALDAAARSGAPVIPVFVLDEESGIRPLGGAARWWLHGSLVSLERSLLERGGRLVLRRGAAETVLPALAAEMGAGSVLWNRSYEPTTRARDDGAEAALRRNGISAQSFGGSTLAEPDTMQTGAGGPFKVFGAFWKALRKRYQPAPPLPAPERLPDPQRWPESERLADWALRPTRPDWARGFSIWHPGERGATDALGRFVDHALSGYATGRNHPGQRGTSRLSQHLRFGEIAPAQVWRAVEDAVARGAAPSDDGEAYLRELGWREFCRHLLFHFPDLPARPWRKEFERLAWRSDAAALRAWQRGRTGYPVVDAGMRELWGTGWMHNRVRMIVASFLTKHLLIDWREGEAWFWDTLIDADLANNAANWQWVAGSGADAAPFFRIFNPVLQGERFDPDGDYVRRWVPELARLPAPDIHRPWTSSRLNEAGVTLGETYPKPIVEHAAARRRALEVFARVKG